MKKILFDSDLIGDDLLALIAMALEPETELLAITAYGRRIGGLRRAQIALKMADVLGMRNVDIVPGADAPLARDPRPGCMHCDRVIDSFMDEDCPSCGQGGNRVLAGSQAAQYIVEATRKSPGEISLLCTGPLTNVALALLLDPGVAKRLREIVVMGGADMVPGNASPHAESNFLNDPEAADLVCRKLDNLIMVGLDVTLRTCIDKRAMGGLPPSALSRFLEALVSSCCTAHRERGSGSIMPLHDLLAFYALVDPSIIGTDECEIRVETRSAAAYGMSFCDRRSARKTHRVATSVDVGRALARFSDLIRIISHNLDSRGRPGRA